MLRLLNHSERLKVGKRVVSEKKKKNPLTDKPSGRQTIQSTKLRINVQPESPLTLDIHGRHLKGSLSFRGTNSRRRCSTALLPETSLVFIVHLLLHLIQHLLHPLQLQAQMKKSVWLRSPNLLYINPDQLKLDYTVF